MPLPCFVQVHHVLSHTSGLANAMASAIAGSPFLLCDWEESLKQMAAAVPDSAPGSEEQYHYLSFGWLCGGIIEVQLPLGDPSISPG